MATRLYTLRACDDGVLLYPVYALLFADAGLSGGHISSLFAIWSVVTFVLEIPSGAWADAFSRRRLLAFGGVLRALAFTLWLVYPSYPAFAVGFVLWGISSAVESGTMQALVYDELVAVGAARQYARILGRSGTVGLLAMLATTALASPAMAVGGYPLVGAASVAAALAFAAVALSLPERPRARATSTGDGPDGDGGDGLPGGGPVDADGTGVPAGPTGNLAALRHYGRTLRAGLAEARVDSRVTRTVALAALVPALTAIDEYLPLLARAMGTSTVGVPLLLLLPAAAMAAASGAAGRFAGASARAVAVAFAVAAFLLAGGALVPHAAGMVAVAAFFAVMQVGMVLTDARLQEAITGPARATVTSVAGFGSEALAVVVFLSFAAGSTWTDVPVLIAICAVPVVGLALLTGRWLPPHRE